MKSISKKLIALFLIVSLCLAFSSCYSAGNGNQDAGNNEQDETNNEQGAGDIENKTAAAVVTIDINPSVELTVNEDGVVISVYGSNEDGKILLCGEDAELIGKTVEEAVEYITNLATELGFLDGETGTVSTSVIADSEALLTEIKTKVDERIVEAAEAHGISVSISEEVAFEISARLEELKSYYPDVEEIQNLTPEKYRQLLSVIESGDVTVEEAIKMTDAELVTKINEAHATLSTYATDAYLEAKARALVMFESSMGPLTDGIYTQIYAMRLSSIFTNPEYINTIHYGATYQAYKTTARTYLCVLEIMKFADEYTNYELNEETVNAIKSELNITDDSLLRDENGKITLGSVSKFCYEYVDSHPVTEEAKARILEILAEAKDASQLVIMAGESYKVELQLLCDSINATITTVTATSSAMLPFLPEEAKAELAACIDYLKESGARLTDIMANGATDDEIIALAAEAQANADAMLEKINADLTDEEKAMADEMYESISAQIKTLTEQFEARLTTAENAAKEYIENKREQRKNGAKESE